MVWQVASYLQKFTQYGKIEAITEHISQHTKVGNIWNRSEKLLSKERNLLDYVEIACQKFKLKSNILYAIYLTHI